MPVRINYNGEEIASLNGGAIAELKCKDRKMKSDILISVPNLNEGSSSDERVKYVTFMYGATELIKYPVVVGDAVHDPVEKGLIDEPTKESTVSNVYPFGGWNLTDGGEPDPSALQNVTEDRTVYAAFTEEVRKYTVRFFDGENILITQQVGYGSKAIPPDTFREGYEFKGWTPNDLTITEDTDFYGTWEIDQGWLISMAFPQTYSQCRYAKYSTDGTRLFFVVDQTVYMYDATTQPYTLLHSKNLNIGTKSVYDLDVSSDGKWLAVTHDTTSSSSKYLKYSMKIYSITNDTLSLTTKVDSISGQTTGGCQAVRFLPNSSKLIVSWGLTSSASNTYIFAFNVSSSSTWTYSTVQVTSVKAWSRFEISPDATKLVGLCREYDTSISSTAAYDGKVHILDMSNNYTNVTSTYISTILGENDVQPFGRLLAYSPDGKFLAIAKGVNTSYSGTNLYPLMVYDTTTTPYTLAYKVQVNSTTKYNIKGISFSNDGSMLAVVKDTSPYMEIYDTSTWTLKEEAKIMPSDIGICAAFSAENHLVVGLNSSPGAMLYRVKE